MVDYFSDRPGELPGGDQTGPLSDTATWHNLHNVAESVVKYCVLENEQFGWQMTGKDYETTPVHLLVEIIRASLLLL